MKIIIAALAAFSITALAAPPEPALQGPSRGQSAVDFVLHGPKSQPTCACLDSDTYCCNFNGDMKCETRVCWYMPPTKKDPPVVAEMRKLLLQKIIEKALTIPAPTLMANVECPGGCNQRPDPPVCDLWHIWNCQVGGPVKPKPRT